MNKVENPQTQAELEFSLDDRKEMEYPLRVRRFRGFVSEISSFFASNSLITNGEDRVRVYPGIAQVLLRKANEDVSEPVVIMSAGHFKSPSVADIQVVRLQLDEMGIVSWQVSEKYQATSDDLDEFCTILNEVSSPETEETIKIRPDEAALMDAVYLGLEEKNMAQIQKARKERKELTPHNGRVFRLADIQEGVGLITAEDGHKVRGLMNKWPPNKNDFDETRGLLVKPQWQPQK